MTFKVLRDGIQIVPDDEQDAAYIEDTLGLRKDGDSIALVRKNCHGISTLAWLKTNRDMSVARKEEELT